jgi:hypothetical protein
MQMKPRSHSGIMGRPALPNSLSPNADTRPMEPIEFVRERFARYY